MKRIKYNTVHYLLISVILMTLFALTILATGVATATPGKAGNPSTYTQVNQVAHRSTPESFVSVAKNVEHVGVEHILNSGTSASQGVGPVVVHLAGALPSMPPSKPANANGGSSIPPAVWDEQIALTFARSYTSMTWNVTAIPQTGNYGYGPGYMLNGLTDQGWWYQVWLSYDWPYIHGGYYSGFTMGYEVFSSNGSSVFPTSGGGGLLSFNGPVNSYDIVALHLYFSGSSVVMEAYDWDTGASASISYPAYGSIFVGSNQGGYTAINSNGFWTGLMTEQYHVNQYYGDEIPTAYTGSGNILTSAWMWADEWDPYNGTLLFFAASQSDLAAQPSAFSYFSTNGTNQYAAADWYGGAIYITGALGITVANLGYNSIGGLLSKSPNLTVTAPGYTETFTLNATITGEVFPRGAAWSATPQIQASATERWATQQSSGTLNAPYQELILDYYYQYQVSFSYGVVGGGSGYSPPTVDYTSFGAQVRTQAGGGSVWVDAGTAYTYQATVTGSSSTERWATQSATGTVNGAGTVSPTYYHQYQVSFGFNIVGGGSGYTPPQVTYTSFGSQEQTTAGGGTVWVDAGASWYYPHLLQGSSSTERWVAVGVWNGSITQPAQVGVSYHHQFYVGFTSNDAAGGSVNTLSGWYDAGSQIDLSATPSPGWTLHGWVGSGEGSYTGGPGGVANVGGPLNETAVFYAGLTLSAAGQGSITYQSGAQSGSVGAGQSATIYLPPGSQVNLTESPSSILYAFSEWSGAVAGSARSTTFVVSAPVSVYAHFDNNYLFLTLVGVIVVVLIVGGLLASRRRRS